MGIGKQAKILNKNQIDMIAGYLPSHRNGKRNLVIFLQSEGYSDVGRSLFSSDDTAVH